MIDLTPLDVRKKRGDFTKGLRGYDPQQVDSFLELAAERLEELVKENLTLRERVDRLGERVEAHSGREQAVNDALVTAQQLREEIQTSAQREADLVRRECESEVEQLRRSAQAEADRLRVDAEQEAERIVREADRQLTEKTQLLQEVERRRARFLVSYRQLLERELDMVVVQEGSEAVENRPIDMDLMGGRQRDSERSPDVQRVANDGPSRPETQTPSAPEPEAAETPRHGAHGSRSHDAPPMRDEARDRDLPPGKDDARHREAPSARDVAADPEPADDGETSSPPERSETAATAAVPAHDEDERPSPDADVHSLAADPPRYPASGDKREEKEPASEDAWLSRIMDSDARREDA